MTSVRYVAIGDSFTEGVGDERPDGTPRGWADLAARGWAASLGGSIEYANLAIRGRLAWPVVDEQLEPALALKPTHLSFNGGGNDMLRPGSNTSGIVDTFVKVLMRCREEGVVPILLAGADPSGGLPMSRLIRSRGDALFAAVTARLRGADDIVWAINWTDEKLRDQAFWSPDRLHMNSRGHHRVAARVLDALGQRVDPEWWDLPEPAEPHLGTREYYRAHVAPWVKRRVTRTSSGDGRRPKHPAYVTVGAA
ncbi:SGNH/GDSL hydrolase family protein [Microbacterium halophytorum]|uniref:SGNH/GDSL hydrolase family protein n=1 Tax=Microbacterium halophytorum TaxID=2067568 RepID=UPI001574CC9C|nr:SGNH/GDSL hydrolase family protein [Microbacterium halophytorum]